MLFKFTFVPNPGMTEQKLVGDLYSQVEKQDIDEMMREIFRPVVSSEYNVFVYSDNMIDAIRKLNSWFDEESCVLNHPAYEKIIMNMFAECIDTTDNAPVLLNALSVIT